MRKFFTLAAMLLMMVVSANATKKYATFETPAGNGAWNAETCTYSWTAGYSNLVTIFETPNGSLADYKSLHLTTSDYTNAYRICFMNGSTAVATIPFYSEGQKDLVFADRSEIKDIDLSTIDHIAFGGASDAGSVTLKKVYLEKPTEITFNDAGKAYIYPSDFTLNGWQGMTFDDQTGLLTKTKTGYEGITIDFGTTGIDFSNITNIEVNTNTSSESGYVNLFGYGTVKDLNGHTQYISGATGNYSKGNDIDSNIKTYYLGANETTGSMILNYVCLTSKTAECLAAGETSLKTLPFLNSTGTEVTPTWNVDGASTNGTAYGEGDGTAAKYADITNYEELRIYEESNQYLRLFLIPSTGFGSSVVQVAYNEAPATWNADKKYLSFNISKLKESANWDGKVALQAIKAAAGSNFSTPIKKIVVYKTPEAGSAQYYISGSGVISSDAKAALADATATIIDATGLTGSNITLTSANPNCIFKASAGVLANENNVMIDGTIASLAITDGMPFAVPSGATATAATYTRGAGGTYGTICLPYAVSSNTSVQYYTLGANDGSTLTIEPAATVAAGTPAIFKNLTDGSYISATGSGTLAIVNADGQASTNTSGTKFTLKGTYVQQKFTTDLDKKYYISRDQVKQATASLTVNPFRAYFEAETIGGGAKSSYNLTVADNTTAINALFNAENSDVKVAGIFNADGTQQGELQKGINIVKFSNGMTKKVIIK